MTDEMIRLFSSLVYFLGKVLGPDYEVTLYDLDAGANAVIAIANGRISGQTIGAPLPETVQAMLRQGQCEGGDYVLNFASRLQTTGKVIRSSTMLIRDTAGQPVGMLGINFDDSRFLSLSNRILDLIHPYNFIEEQYETTEVSTADLTKPADAVGRPLPKENIFDDVSSMIQEIFTEASRSLTVPADRLTQDERMIFIAQLKKQGMFRLKGSVQYTAENLGCSQASIYRYLSKLKSENKVL